MGNQLRALLSAVLIMGGFFCAVFWLGVEDLSVLSPMESARPVSDTVTEHPRPAVIIDAGHGGEDGGAVSAAGTAEKSLNLSIALTLGDMLGVCGVDVICTRTDDNGLYDGAVQGHRKMTDLKNRLAVQQSHPDAVFLSIHMNAFSDTRYHGMQLFYSPADPSSAVLAETLRKTNQTYLQNDNTRACKEADSSIFLLDRAKGTAVLAECGFLSNPDEAADLMTAEYREQIAAVLCVGILNYFKETSVQ